MNNHTTPVETLLEKVEDYSKKTIELITLNVIDKSADVISSLVSQLVIGLVVAMFALTINIGIAFWIGELLGKSYYGFFVIAGFYLFVVGLLYIFRHRWIKTPVSNSFIAQMLKQKIL